MMRMLEAGGVPLLTDGRRVPDQDNPNGYYEFEAVKKLKEGGFAWLDGAQGRAVKIISALLLHLPPSHLYRVIFMRRRMNEILASQRQMLLNRGEDASHTLGGDLERIYVKHLAQARRWIESQPNVSCLEVDYNRLVQSPALLSARVSAFLGGGLDEASMSACVDARLYRQRMGG